MNYILPILSGALLIFGGLSMLISAVYYKGVDKFKYVNPNYSYETTLSNGEKVNLKYSEVDKAIENFRKIKTNSYGIEILDQPKGVNPPMRYFSPATTTKRAMVCDMDTAGNTDCRLATQEEIDKFNKEK